MPDFMTAPLSELKNKLIADGKISRAEAGQIRKRLLEDRTVDRYEAEFMFAVNDAVRNERSAAKFDELFIDAITSHVLDSGLYPEILHEDEWAWLEEKLMKDFDVGDLETRLLKNIGKKAKSVPTGFQAYIKDLDETADLEEGGDGTEDGSFFGRLLRRLTG